MDKTCDTCAETFTAARSDARYCSGRCRTIGYRKRKDGDRPKRHRASLERSMLNAALDLDRETRRWTRIAQDDRFTKTAATHTRYREDLVRAIAALEAVVEEWPPGN